MKNYASAIPNLKEEKKGFQNKIVTQKRTFLAYVYQAWMQELYYKVMREGTRKKSVPRPKLSKKVDSRPV